ncbi:hypothetical protein AAFF_G00308780 [Aldrovandia affinis]|uniref:Uncharacterized protein n=1 Tax=Aldrovandia affinis TaxID=143900 RepID=A0AAD7WR52_9TELE|nr:hypothetical protein AAFF_G00308780 [Aldrovandia affinis]
MLMTQRDSISDISHLSLWIQSASVRHYRPAVVINIGEEMESLSAPSKHISPNYLARIFAGTWGNSSRRVTPEEGIRGEGMFLHEKTFSKIRGTGVGHGGEGAGTR